MHSQFAAALIHTAIISCINIATEFTGTGYADENKWNTLMYHLTRVVRALNDIIIPHTED